MGGGVAANCGIFLLRNIVLQYYRKQHLQGNKVVHIAANAKNDRKKGSKFTSELYLYSHKFKALLQSTLLVMSFIAKIAKENTKETRQCCTSL